MRDPRDRDFSPGRAGIALLLAAGLALAAAAESSRAPAPGSAGRFDTVVIDAGHGGDDHGARGAGGLLEKQLVLELARQLAERLRESELRVVMTREDDSFVPLERRTAIANDARGDLFVSIHANAAEDHRVRGIETFFLSLDASDEASRRVATRENQAFGRAHGGSGAGGDPLLAIFGDLIATEHMTESSEFARLAQGNLIGPDGDGSRGVKQAPFVVLMGVQMPASLVEVGFLTNGRDERGLREKWRRGQITAALAEAVIEFGRRYDARRGVATAR